MPKTVHSDSLTVPQTRWSAVARAAQAGTEIRLKALNELLETYLPVLRRHLVSNLRVRPDRADDLLQRFVAQKVAAEERPCPDRQGQGTVSQLPAEGVHPSGCAFGSVLAPSSL
jgi:hypothetical protein